MAESLFLRACRGDAVPRTPVWIMRQAGRYLPEYRAVREKHDFLTTCRTPELACELTLQPVRRLGVDAAIVFSDILVPLPGMGVEVEFDPGPKLARAIRTRADVKSLRRADPHETTPFLLEALRLIRKELNGSVPVIGFAGAPFTLAAYLVEGGGGSRGFAALKTFLYDDPSTAHRLLALCADTVADSLVAQARAGAQAVMLFDSWAGILAPSDDLEFALPYARTVFDRVAASFPAGAVPPRIYYAGDGSAGRVAQLARAGADVIGLDWRVDLEDARRALGPRVVLQGNLDPAALLGPQPAIRARVEAVLRSARRGEGGDDTRAARGHVFNLGHGILPLTPPKHAELVVQYVKELSAGAVV